MPRRHPARWSVLASLAALGLLGGCGQMDHRPKQHASEALLSSGPSEKVSARQAADIQVAMGRSHEDEGKPEEAEAAYRLALKKDPKRVDAEARLAVLSDKKGDAAAADKHFARALKLAPKDPEILCDRGYSLYLRRRWAESEESLRQAIAAKHDHARSHNNLGLVLARRGDTEGALVEFGRAGCDPADARANLGLVLALEGRLEDSAREYKLALAAKPDSPLAKEGLKAATVALASRDDDQVLAAAEKPAPKADLAVGRASATEKPAPRAGKPAPQVEKPAPKADAAVGRASATVKVARREKPGPKVDAAVARASATEKPAPRAGKPASKGGKPAPKVDKPAPQVDKPAPKVDAAVARASATGSKPAPRAEVAVSRSWWHWHWW